MDGFDELDELAMDLRSTRHERRTENSMTDVLNEIRFDLQNLVAKLDRIGNKLDDDRQLTAMSLASGLVSSAAIEVGKAVKRGRELEQRSVAVPVPIIRMVAK